MRLGPAEAVEPVLAGGGSPGLERAHRADVLVLADVAVAVAVAAAIGRPFVQIDLAPQAPRVHLGELRGHQHPRCRCPTGRRIG